MTDLSKGIIEVDGFEINRETTSDDIKNKLIHLYANYTTSKNSNIEIFTFKKVEIFDRCFNLDIAFRRKKILFIDLFPYYNENLSYEERFEDDCEWLKKLLGKPNDINKKSCSYRYPGICIYPFIQRDLSRNPADTHITCNYENY